MKDYKHTVYKEPLSAKELILNILASCGFILAMGALLFLRGLL